MASSLTESAGDTDQEVTPTLLARELAALRECGGDRFNPARFRYIESMVRRGQGRSERVAGAIERKALEALQRYQADLALARESAEQTVAELSAKCPDATETVQRLYNSRDFTALQRFAVRLEQGAPRGALGPLIDRLSQAEPEPDGPLTGGCLDEYLRLQESEIVGGGTEQLARPSGVGAGAAAGRGMELRSARRCRESRARMAADRLVSRSVEQCPENSGPLNSHRLAMRSLVVMRDISPQYLNRFVAYMDTLLWLEQESEAKGLTSSRKDQKKAGSTRSRR